MKPKVEKGEASSSSAGGGRRSSPRSPGKGKKPEEVDTEEDTGEPPLKKGKKNDEPKGKKRKHS